MKREGTILYRNNGDIMHALSHSLAENKNHDCLTNVTDVLNNLLHEQAKGFLKRYKGHPEAEMSLENEICIVESVDSICRDSAGTQYMLIQTNFSKSPKQQD